jgi:hypothetical protein
MTYDFSLEKYRPLKTNPLELFVLYTHTEAAFWNQLVRTENLNSYGLICWVWMPPPAAKPNSPAHEKQTFRLHYTCDRNQGRNKSGGLEAHRTGPGRPAAATSYLPAAAETAKPLQCQQSSERASLASGRSETSGPHWRCGGERRGA